MNLMLFGTSSRALFGVYSPAAGRRRRTGAVICPPFGQEYLRSHRAIRTLADRLSAAGVDVLRFDYYGTGDSAGDSNDVTLEGCIEDTRHAINELVAVAAVSNVVVIGLRLGAAIALKAANGTGIVQRTVLWDPITNGASYVAELLEDDPNMAVESTDDVFAKGFPVTAEFRRELVEMQPAGLGTGAGRNLLVASRESADSQTLRSTIAADRLEVAVFEGPPAWLEFEHLGAGVLPVRILNHITSWCAS